MTAAEFRNRLIEPRSVLWMGDWSTPNDDDNLRLVLINLLNLPYADDVLDLVLGGKEDR